MLSNVLFHLQNSKRFGFQWPFLDLFLSLVWWEQHLAMPRAPGGKGHLSTLLDRWTNCVFFQRWCKGKEMGAYSSYWLPFLSCCFNFGRQIILIRWRRPLSNELHILSSFFPPQYYKVDSANSYASQFHGWVGFRVWFVLFLVYTYFHLPQKLRGGAHKKEIKFFILWEGRFTISQELESAPKLGALDDPWKWKHLRLLPWCLWDICEYN